ncbi:MAG: hypothetical protein ABL974_15600 [Prosthecobacter sp.]
MKHLWLTMILLISACTQPLPPQRLYDGDAIPAGSALVFWVHHDESGWKKSNIHVKSLPRRMTVREARLWAQGTGDRDAGLSWTHYYVAVTLPGSAATTLRTGIYERPTRPQALSAYPH